MEWIINMALKENKIIYRIDIIGEFKHINVIEDTQIIDEDTKEVKVGERFSNYILVPNQDISSQPTDVKAIANAVWTDEVKAAWAAHIAE